MKEKVIDLSVVSNIDGLKVTNVYKYNLIYKKNNLLKVINSFNTEISPTSGIGEFIYKNFKEYNESNNSGVFDINGGNDNI
jgi:hypothetical protein